MKKIFRLNDVKWIKVIQILLYFSLGVTFITNLTKNDLDYLKRDYRRENPNLIIQDLGAKYNQPKN